MAKATWRMPEDFLMKVSRLADKTDEILPKVLEAGAEVVEDKVRSNLQLVIGSGTKYESRSTGELLRSLGTSPALQDMREVMIRRWREKRGESNNDTCNDKPLHGDPNSQ